MDSELLFKWISSTLKKQLNFSHSSFNFIHVHERIFSLLLSKLKCPNKFGGEPDLSSISVELNFKTLFFKASQKISLVLLKWV
jgi:hypothetical protein